MKRIVLFSLLASMALVGCGSTNPMVGTWKLQIDESALQQMPPGMKKPDLTLEFKADGTMTGSFVTESRESTMAGTYKLDGKTLTMKMTEEDGKPRADAKEDSVTLSDDMKSFEIPGAGAQGKMVKQ